MYFQNFVKFKFFFTVFVFSVKLCVSVGNEDVNTLTQVPIHHTTQFMTQVPIWNENAIHEHDRIPMDEKLFMKAGDIAFPSFDRFHLVNPVKDAELFQKLNNQNIEIIVQTPIIAHITNTIQINDNQNLLNLNFIRIFAYLAECQQGRRHQKWQVVARGTTEISNNISIDLEWTTIATSPVKKSWHTPSGQLKPFQLLIEIQDKNGKLFSLNPIPVEVIRDNSVFFRRRETRPRAILMQKRQTQNLPINAEMQLNCENIRGSQRRICLQRSSFPGNNRRHNIPRNQLASDWPIAAKQRQFAHF